MPIRDERRMRFVYVRYHGVGLFANNVQRMLMPTLRKMQDVKIPEDRYIWAVGDIGEMDLDHSKIIFGRLGKTAQEVVETVYDDKRHSYTREQVQSRKAAYSNFFIEPKSSIMALEDKQLLPRSRFLEIFQDFWKRSEPSSELDFDFIKNEIEIFEVIRRWERITLAQFDLSPTNPHPREDFAPLDDIIKKANARRAKLKFEPADGGLAKRDSIIQQGTSMSAAGYGEFKLKGVERGSVKVLSSNSLLVTNEIVKIDDLSALSPEVLREIRKIVQAMHNGKTQK